MTYGLDTSAVLRLLTGEPQELALRVVHRVMEIFRSGGFCTVSDLSRRKLLRSAIPL